MALRSRYLSESTEEFQLSNQIILRKLTNAKSDLQTYRKIDRKSLELKEILLNSKFYLRKKRLLNISNENQRIFERINFHRHRKLKPIDFYHPYQKDEHHHLLSTSNHKKKQRRLLTVDKQNQVQERILSPLREILDDYRSAHRRKTQY